MQASDLFHQAPQAAINPQTGQPFVLSDFDYELPPELIAQHPTQERSGSRLLDAREPTPVDRGFRELPDLLNPGDLIVFNDTQVIHARLFGHKSSGGAVELLVERVLAGDVQAPHQVVAHMKTSKKPLIGATLTMLDKRGEPAFTARLLGRWPTDDGAMFRCAFSAEPHSLMAAHGHVPLPPYINHADNAQDAARFQTVLAKHPGAVAAPTAALHFDQTVLDALDAKGVQRTCITLHVGAGTFQPVKTHAIHEHVMHSEWFNIDCAAASALAQLAQRQRQAVESGQPVPRLIAVGTTSVRTLESWAQMGSPQPRLGESISGDTRIFITPGFEFQIVDTLVTNFHLPKSSLMMLISAFAGHGHVMKTYAHAIAQQYRFFSYGDSMLLSKPPTV